MLLVPERDRAHSWVSRGLGHAQLGLRSRKNWRTAGCEATRSPSCDYGPSSAEEFAGGPSRAFTPRLRRDYGRLTCPAILAVASRAVPTIDGATRREAGGGHHQSRFTRLRRAMAQECGFAHPTDRD